MWRLMLMYTVDEYVISKEVFENMNRKVDYITLDLDDRTEKAVSWVLYNLFRIRLECKGEVWKKDKKHYHITIRLKNPIEFSKSVCLRLLLLDDPYRVKMDCIRYLYGNHERINVLFKRKIKVLRMKKKVLFVWRKKEYKKIIEFEVLEDRMKIRFLDLKHVFGVLEHDR